MATFFGGGLGKAEDALRKRKEKLKEAEEMANPPPKDREKKSRMAADGKYRLSTTDKKY